MTSEWHKLTDLTGGKEYIVTSVKIKGDDISINGEFELPLMARLSFEDQVFVGEFIRSHGSIKHMEKAFGISYPTVKNRLNNIAQQMKLVEVRTLTFREEILIQLESGEISAKEALERLKNESSTS